jgi:mRNA-degrading endonuclease HigB of HigAB toxin-antitoxin module
MRVIAIKTLSVFWQAEPESKTALQAWYAEAGEADWDKPTDVKAKWQRLPAGGEDQLSVPDHLHSFRWNARRIRQH